MDQWIHKWIWDDKSGSCNCKVDEQVLSICGSMGCHRFGAYSGRAVHMKQDTPFLSISAIPDGVCFLVCVCMQFMHSRVNVFYWHMDAWILPHCYTWKSTGHIQTVEALQMWHLAVSTLLQVFTSRMFIEVAFPRTLVEPRPANCGTAWNMECDEPWLTICIADGAAVSWFHWQFLSEFGKLGKLWQNWKPNQQISKLGGL